jgi:O-acetylhomoserine (thiol)-lyase
MRSARFETLAVHGGFKPDKSTNSLGIPVHRTTAYSFDSAQHAARLFALEEEGNIYTRLGNPTQAMLEERMSLLEGAAGAVAFTSGTAAVFSAIINIAAQGDEIVSANNLYGGTYTMFDSILPQMGIRAHFTAPNDFAAMRAAINERTRAIYIETIGNPALDVADVAQTARLAHEHGIALLVDATFTTPYLLRVFEHGADIVIQSLSKWIGGHGTGIGGIVLSRGGFPWNNGRYPLYDQPDAGFHGLRFGHDLQDKDPFLARLRCVPLRNLGPCIAPDNAWMFLQGLETLPLRMDRHCANAMSVAKFLQEHQNVVWVRFPGLENDPSHVIAKKYLLKGYGGMVVFGIKGGKSAGQRFIDCLNLFSHVANVGDAKSLALHPGSTTHFQLSDEQQISAGLKPDMIRLSIGIEHIDDILDDLRQALDAACQSG